MSGIKPNPRVESVEEGVGIYLKNGCDFILAVGGGSSLDACKAIAAGVKYDGPVTDLFVGETGLSPISEAAPLATILTMAGTGSEMDMGAVITVGDDHKKEVVMHPLVNSKFSILDPEYTYIVPEYHSMAAVADILCHLMEQYFTPDANAKVQDRMNEGVMQVVLEDAPKIPADPKDYDARANIMWAISMALAGFQFLLGKPMFAFPLHGMGHELSSKYDMTHGVTLTLLTPSWMRHTMRTAPLNTCLCLRDLPVMSWESSRKTMPGPRKKVSRSWKHSMVPSKCLQTFTRQVSRKNTWKPSQRKQSKEETWAS